MKIVIAPDSFKESLSATEVAGAFEEGFLKVFPHAEFVKVPMADGGGPCLILSGFAKWTNFSAGGNRSAWS